MTKYFIYQDRKDAIGFVNNNLVKELDYVNVSVKHGNNGTLNHVKDIMFAFRLLRKLKKDDTIFLGNLKSLTAYILNKYFKGKKYGIFYHIEKDRLAEFLGYERLLGNFTVLIASSKTYTDLYLNNILEDNMRIIKLCCDRVYSNLDMERVNDLIYVGSFAKRKNIYRMLLAIRYLKCHRIKTNLTIVNGYGPGLKEVNDLIKKWDIGDRVTIKQNLSKIDLLLEYSTHKLLIYPTLLEGLGLPLIEAAKCGCGIITSQMIHHKNITLHSCCYVNPYNYKDIGLGIVNSLHNIDKLLQGSKKIDDHYNWDKTVKEINKIIK